MSWATLAGWFGALTRYAAQRAGYEFRFQLARPSRITPLAGGVIQRRHDPAQLYVRRPSGRILHVTRYEGTPLQVVSQLMPEPQPRRIG